MNSKESKEIQENWAESTMNCPVRNLRVHYKRFYHFYSRGCCSTYNYLSGVFCEREDECKKLMVYDQCPLLKEFTE